MAFVQTILRDLRTPLYRNAFFLIADMALANGIGFFFWIVVARYYSPHDVGLAAAAIPIMGLIGMLSGFGLGAGIVRFLPSSGKNSKAMINSCFVVSGAASILISTVFLVGLEIWSPPLLFIREDWRFLVSFVLFSFAFTLFPMMIQVFVANRNAKWALAGTSITGLRVLLPVLLASWLGIFGIVASWSIAMLVAVIVGIFLFIPRVNPGYRPALAVDKNVLNDMLHFSSGNYVAAVFVIVPTALAPLLIVNTMSAASVAHYYIAFTIAGLLFAVTGAVCMSLFAEGSHSQKDLKEDVRKALSLILALLIPGVVVIFFFGEYVLLLFGPEYATEGLAILRIFALSSILVALNGVYLATRRILKRLRPLITIRVFEAFAFLGMGYVFLSMAGLLGIAIAWILSNGIVTCAIGVHLLWKKRTMMNGK